VLAHLGEFGHGERAVGDMPGGQEDVLDIAVPSPVGSARLVMKSLGAAVRTSKASPPACSTALLARRAISSKWLKQMASWDDELTIAIFGLVMSSSVSPSARHCARLVAQRDVPGSKLLRSGLG